MTIPNESKSNSNNPDTNPKAINPTVPEQGKMPTHWLLPANISVAKEGTRPKSERLHSNYKNATKPLSESIKNPLTTFANQINSIILDLLRY